MELADLTKNFGSLSNLLTDWLNCLRHPLKCCEQQLLELETEDAKIKRAVSTWMTSFVITLVILLPLYALIGIDLKKVEFHLPAFVILFLSFLCSGMASHIGFRDHHELLYAVTHFNGLPFIFAPADGNEGGQSASFGDR
jgi:uncharacterized integral membrane protein